MRGRRDSRRPGPTRIDWSRTPISISTILSQLACFGVRRFVLARQLARGARTRLLIQRPFQIGFDEAALGSVNGRSAHGQSCSHDFVARPCVRGQQNLPSFELARRVSAADQKHGPFVALRLAQFDAIEYVHLIPLAFRAADESPMNPIFDQPTENTGPHFTPLQGQYLAFIYAYTRVLGRPPAEADMQRHFKVTAPSVHQMVLTLERNGLVKRRPAVPRSLEILIAPERLPVLR